jgi:molybdate transport system permease protein
VLPSDLSPLWLTLEIAGLATLVTTVLGTAAARALLYRNLKLRLALEVIFLCPLVLPPTVIGYGLMVVLGRHGPFAYLLGDSLLFTKTASITAAVIVSFPLMYMSARAAFRSIDATLTDAARAFGARGFRALTTIQIPLAAQGLLVGLLLTFGRSLGEFGATLMVAGNIPGHTQTLPIALYFDVEAGDYPGAGFWSVLALVMSGLLIWAINFISETKGLRR